jgi:Tol biopolymer transport system component
MISVTGSRRWIALVAPVVLLLGLGVTARRTAQAAFPGDNGLIVFDRYPRNSSPWEEIFTIRPDGTGLTRLTHNNGNQVSDVMPTWSPSGDEIAYVRVPNPGDGELLIMDSSGTVLQKVTNNQIPDVEPAWSPDGQKLAFVRGNFASRDVWVKDLSTGQLTQITDDPADDFHPRWSPLGNQIVFAREFDNGAYYQVFVIDVDPVTAVPDPTSETNLSNDPSVSDFMPDWSPNANHLTFARFKSNWGGDNEIVRMNLSTGVVTRLTTNPVVDFDPAWSPNGKRIVWARGPEEQDTELVTMNASSGANQVILTGNQVVDQQPDWQPR